MKIHRLLAAASAAFFIVAPVKAQQAGDVTANAFVIGGGPGTTGFVSLLCGAAQIAVGQSAAAPICQTITGDVTISAAGVTAIGATKVTSAMLNADVYSTAHTWSGQQTFVAPILGAPASGTLTNATGLPISTGVAGLGSGVATFLATPSSANLRGALTDETGTGAAVFADSPALTGTPTAPTASPSDNSTKVATTAYVDAQVSAGVAGVSSLGNRTGVITIDGGNLSSNVLTVPRYDASQSLSAGQQLQARQNIGARSRVLLTSVAPSLVSHDFTLPTGVRQFTATYANMSTNGTGIPMLQFGDAGGIEASGYTGTAQSGTTAVLNNSVNGILTHVGAAATTQTSGSITCTLNDTTNNLWACSGTTGQSDAASVAVIGGHKALSQELTTVRFTTSNGTSVYDGGLINVLYEAP